MHLPARPSTVQTDPVTRFDLCIRGVLRAVESELQSLVYQARLHQKDEPRPTGMIQLNNDVFYDSNSDDDDVEELFHDSDTGGNTPVDNVNGECINNNFRLPIGQE